MGRKEGKETVVRILNKLIHLKRGEEQAQWFQFIISGRDAETDRSVRLIG